MQVKANSTDKKSQFDRGSNPWRSARHKPEEDALSNWGMITPKIPLGFLTVQRLLDCRDVTNKQNIDDRIRDGQ